MKNKKVKIGIISTLLVAVVCVCVSVFPNININSQNQSNDAENAATFAPESTQKSVNVNKDASLPQTPQQVYADTSVIEPNDLESYMANAFKVCTSDNNDNSGQSNENNAKNTSKNTNSNIFNLNRNNEDPYTLYWKITNDETTQYNVLNISKEESEEEGWNKYEQTAGDPHPGWFNYKGRFAKVIIHKAIAPLTTKAWFGCMDKEESGKVQLSQIEEIEGIENLDTSNVEDASFMFIGCTHLDKWKWNPATTSSLNLSNVTNAFGICGFTKMSNTQLNYIAKQLSKATDLGLSFSNNEKLEELDLSSNTVCTNFRYMLAHNDQTKDNTMLNIVTLNTINNGTNFIGMFMNCSKLRTINASDDCTTTGVSTNMFKGCDSLIGGNGYKYDPNKTDGTMAKVDVTVSGDNHQGYFTYQYTPDPVQPEPEKMAINLKYNVEDETYKDYVQSIPPVEGASFKVQGETAMPDPTKEGDTFLGWKLSKLATNNLYATSSNLVPTDEMMDDARTIILDPVWESDISVEVPTPKANLKYNQTQQDLVNPGTTTLGELQYSSDGGQTYKTDVPQGKAVATYNVSYRVHIEVFKKDIAEGNLDVEIAKGTRTISVSPTSIANMIVQLDSETGTKTLTVTPSVEETGDAYTYSLNSTASDDKIVDIAGNGKTATVKALGGGSNKIDIKLTGDNYEDATNQVSVSVDNWKYKTSTTDGESNANVYAYQYCGLKTLDNLTMPNTIKNNAGTSYDVTAIGTQSATTSSGSVFNGVQTYVKNLTINSSSKVVNINPHAFHGSKIEKCDFSSAASLTTFGDAAFYGCTNLTSCTVPAKLANLGISTSISSSNGVFYNCSALTSFDLSSTAVTIIKPYTFGKCSNLDNTGIKLSSKITEIYRYAFNGSEALNGKTDAVYDASGCCLIGAGTSFSKSRIEIPSTVKCVADYAFYSQTNINYILVGSSALTSQCTMYIGQYAFASCTSLRAYIVKAGTATYDDLQYGANVFNSSKVSTTSGQVYQTAIVGGTNTNALTSGLPTSNIKYYYKELGGNYTTNTTLGNSSTNYYYYLTSDANLGTTSSSISFSTTGSLAIDLNNCNVWHKCTDAESGGYVISVTGATLRIDDSSSTANGWIRGGRNSDNEVGGGIKMTSGTVNMVGGTIRDNIAKRGGGVCMNGNCTFNMYRGKVTENGANTNWALNGFGGGGFYMTNSNAKLNVYDGSIDNNWARTSSKTSGILHQGGGVYLYSGTLHAYKGAYIRKNVDIYSTTDSGVYKKGGTLTIDAGADVASYT